MKKPIPRLSHVFGFHEELTRTPNVVAAINGASLQQQMAQPTVSLDMNRYPLTVLATMVAISAAQHGRAMAVSILGTSPSLARKLVERCQCLFDTTSVEVLFTCRKLNQPTESKLIVTLSQAGMVDTAARLAFLGPNAPRPALLAFNEPPVGEEIFCPWLTYYCDGDEIEKLRSWITACQAEITSDYAATTISDVQNKTLSAMESIITPLLDESADDLFRAVLHGSAILLAASHLGPEPEGIPLAAYGLTQRLLSSRMATVADHTPSRLLRMMVDRANLLIEARQAEQASQTRLKVQRACQKLTRRDFVDLGKPNSPAVHEIISYLRLTAEGDLRRQKLCQMGTHNPETVQTSLVDDTQALQNQLVKWSYKQVRTTLGQAVEAKWLTSDRKNGNGPVIYTLPESSRSLGNPWLALPTEHEIAARFGNTNPAGHGLP